MRFEKLQKTEYAAWDTFCLQHDNLFQTSKWGIFKNAYYASEQKKVPFHIFAVKEDDQILAGMLVIQYPLLGGFSFFYSPWGPVGKREGWTFLIEGVGSYAKKHKIINVKVDPSFRNDDPLLGIVEKKGYRAEGDAILPKTVFLLDTIQKENILKAIPSKYRGRVKNKMNFTFKVIETYDTNAVRAFYHLYAKTGEVKGFSVRSFAYIDLFIQHFIGKHLVIAQLLADGKPIASSLNMLYGKEVAYLYSGITKDEVYEKGYPGYVMVYLMANWCHDHGFERYNLWGGRVTKEQTAWRGFSDFKMNLGGKPEERPGVLTWSIYPKLIGQGMYILCRKLRNGYDF